jgi:dTMP kinase
MDAPYFGELIARFLRGEYGSLESVDPYLVALLYAGDRKDASDMIRDWLKQDKIVLLDRYTYSNIAYQCAKIKDPEAQDRLMKWILALEFDHFRIPRPDLNFFLDVPFSFTENKLSGLRSGNDRIYLNGTKDIHEESLNFQKRVRDIYLRISRMDEHLCVVECHDEKGFIQPPEEIASHILNIINKKRLI